MYNMNFYDPELHQIIKDQPDEVRITILGNPTEEPDRKHTEFMVGDVRTKADADPARLVQYLLKPLLEHHHRPVIIDGRPIERLELQPKASTSYRIMPHPMEGSYNERRDNFAGHRHAGIIVDGVKYLPEHAQWTYNVVAPHSPHRHWSSLTRVRLYPLINLGNPVHSDPAHPDNAAEALRISLTPEYRTHDWTERRNCPEPKDVYDSWTPPQARQTQRPHWALRPMPIAVHGTPAIIDVPNQALAFSIAYALYNQPELGLVPVLEAKAGQRHVTVTCPRPEDVTVTDAQGTTHRAGDGLPPADGPVHAINIPCQADQQAINVKAHLLFVNEPMDHKQEPNLYATGRHRPTDDEKGDVPVIALMAANAFLEWHRTTRPEQYEHQVTQALEGAKKAIEDLMRESAHAMDQALEKLSDFQGVVRVESERWSITYWPKDEQAEDQAR